VEGFHQAIKKTSVVTTVNPYFSNTSLASSENALSVMPRSLSEYPLVGRLLKNVQMQGARNHEE